MNQHLRDRRRFLSLAAVSLLAGRFPQLSWADEPAAVPIVDEHIRHLAAAAALSMQFPGGSADDCRRWQRAFAAKLRSLLGPHTPPAEWQVTTERVVELDDHVRKELVLVAEGHPALPVYLLVPHERGDKSLPGVLAIHGHGQFGYDPVVGKTETPGVKQAIEGANYDYGLQLVRRGYVVVAPSITPFGRRVADRSRYGNQDPCAVTFVRMQLLGKLLIAENLRDTLWAFELLSRQAEVDPQRLGCVGLSYGGRMTMLTSALEPRIGVAVISGALNVMQERISHRYSCGAQVIPSLLRYGDVPEISSLIAPRPCLWEIGSQDGLIIPDWADRALQRIGRAYQAFDAKENLQVDRFEGSHRWSGRLAFPLLERVLKAVS